MKILFVLLILVSCSPSFKRDKHTLRTLSQDYEISLENRESYTVLQSSLIQEPISLQIAASDPKILEAETSNGGSWTHAQTSGINFDRVVLAPYYGLFSYYALQDIKRNEYEHYLPDCPLNTKYLMILFQSPNHFPVFGCVF